MMLKAGKIEFKDGFYKVNVNIDTKFAFVPMKKCSEVVPNSLVELIGIVGFNAGD